MSRQLPLLSTSEYILERSENMYAMCLFNARRATVEDIQGSFMLATRAEDLQRRGQQRSIGG
jgi:hypothetical protein